MIIVRRTAASLQTQTGRGPRPGGGFELQTPVIFEQNSCEYSIAGVQLPRTARVFAPIGLIRNSNRTAIHILLKRNEAFKSPVVGGRASKLYSLSNLTVHAGGR